MVETIADASGGAELEVLARVRGLDPQVGLWQEGAGREWVA